MEILWSQDKKFAILPLHSALPKAAIGLSTTPAIQLHNNMILQRHVVRQTQNLFARAEVCIWCHARQFLDRPTRRHATGRLRKAPSTRIREDRILDLSIPKLRNRIIQREAEHEAEKRYAFLAQAYKDNVTVIDPNTAESLIQEYSNSNLDTILKSMTRHAHKSLLFIQNFVTFNHLVSSAHQLKENQQNPPFPSPPSPSLLIS